MKRVFIDSFSGSVVDLKRGHRTPKDIVRAILNDPLVSCWDLSEHAWVRNGVYDAVKAGYLRENHKQPYPWCRFEVTEAGHALIAEGK